MRLTNRAELFFNVRDQLLGDGIAVRAIVRRVHSIAIREKRTRLDESDKKKARELVRSPVPEEFISGLQPRSSQAFLLVCAVWVFTKVKRRAAYIALSVTQRGSERPGVH